MIKSYYNWITDYKCLIGYLNEMKLFLLGNTYSVKISIFLLFYIALPFIFFTFSNIIKSFLRIVFLSSQRYFHRTYFNHFLKVFIKWIPQDSSEFTHLQYWITLLFPKWMECLLKKKKKGQKSILWQRWLRVYLFLFP